MSLLRPHRGVATGTIKKGQDVSKQFVLVDADALAGIEARIAIIQETLDRVHMQPAPEWVTIDKYAETVGRSVQTVRAWIRQGRVETKQMGSKRMVRA